jgi:type I restriction enzyme S subunit
MKPGYSLVPLQDTATFSRGLTYSKHDEVEVSDNVVLRATNINAVASQLDLSDLRYISDKAAVPADKKVLKDSLLICTASGSKSHLGKVAYIDRDYGYAFGGFMGMITPKNILVPKFLYYQMISRKYKDYIQDLADGTNINNLKFNDLGKFKIVITSLAEQQRIVGVFDKAFAAISAAKDNAEKSIQIAHDFFDRYLESVFTRQDNGWKDRRLGDIFDIGSSKRIHEADWTRTGIPFYGGKEIVKLARYGTVVSNAYISEDKYREYASKFDMPKTGDILMTARGTIGVGYIVEAGHKFYYKDGNIILLRETAKTNPLYILYAFRSKRLTDQIANLTGTTVKHLPIEKAKRLVLAVPDFATQNKVVDKLRELEAKAQSLAEIHTKKLAAFDDLKQSILAKAFSGEL